MHVCLILVPGFRLLVLSLVQEVLRLANDAAGQDLFTWELRSIAGDATLSAEGVEMPAPQADWAAAQGHDLVLVCAGPRPFSHLPMGLRAFLMRAAKAGTTLGGLDGGGMVLARLGLLNGREAVLDLSLEPGFPEKFPDVALSDRSFAFDRQRLTTAGGLAAGDAMLAWIGRVHAPALAATVGDLLERGHLADTADCQTLPRATDPLLERMQAIMATHLADPITLEQVADELDLSMKQMRSRCRKALGLTPAQLYLELRLERAAQLVHETGLSVHDIAGATGFASPSAFTRSYRERFGEPPRLVRRARHKTVQTEGNWVEAEALAQPSPAAKIA